MNGFSKSFNPNELKKGMLVTATYKTGVSRSGIILNVSRELLQFTYIDDVTGSFQNVDITTEQVDNGAVILSFAKHLTEVKTNSQSVHTETQKEEPSLSIDQMLRKYFPIDKFEKLERFLTRQRDAKVIAFILSKLDIPQAKFAKILFSLDDSLSLSVSNFLDMLSNPTTNKDQFKSVEDAVKKILQDYIRNEERPKQDGPFNFGGSSPFGGGNPFEELLGGLGGGNPEEFMGNLQNMAGKIEDVIRKFLDDNNHNNRF